MRYKIEVLSPVHVGSGDELTEFDYVWRDGKLFVLDLDKLLAQRRVRAEELSVLLSKPDFSLADYLDRKRIDPPNVAKYGLHCPSDPRGAKVREQIKDVRNRPYLPGSSLKGAIRTAITWCLLQARAKGPEWIRKALGKLEVDPRNAAQHLEHVLFGEDPTHDLFRALQVSDGTPALAEEMEAREVKIYSLKGKNLVPKRFTIFAEVLKRGTEMELGIRIAQDLFRYEELGFKGKRGWLDLAELCSAHARALLDREGYFFAEHGLEEAARFCNRLGKRIADLGDGFPLRLGWGAGWESKTVGDVVRDRDEELFSELRWRFRLGRKGQPFPKTRRLVEGEHPLGWVLLRNQEG